MSDLNLCQFIGRAGKDPEIRYLTNGDAVANFSLAVGWKTKDKEGVEWVRCNAFGKLAEIVGEYVEKGKQVYVSGRMATRKWQDRDGNDRYTTEINVDRLQLLGGRRDDQEDGEEERRETQPTRTHSEMKAAARSQAPAPARKSTGFDDMDDDIPF